MITTCLLCTADLDGDVRPYESGFVHVSCGESLLFVYGTLRMGGALDGWLPAHLDREPATVVGYALHYAAGHRGYPYLVKTGDDRDLVHGEVVRILAEDTEAVDAEVRVTAMEENAGYLAESLTVILKTGVEEQADAFIWPFPERGPRIESGDWTLTEEWRPEPAVAAQSFRPATSPPTASPDDERAVVYVRMTRPYTLHVRGVDGTPLWEGHSYTAMGRWLKKRNLRAEHDPEDSSE